MITFANEAGGHTATCVCGWVRFSLNQSTVDQAAAEHTTKCKQVDS